MKILMLNYEYPPLGGGGGVIHSHLAEELARRHQVCVITSAFKGLPPSETARGVQVQRVKVIGRKSLPTASLLSMLSFPPSCLRAAGRIINDFQPDIINTHFAVPTGPAGVLLAKKHRLPHVLCIHGGDVFDPSKKLSPHKTPGLRSAVRWVFHRSDCVLAQSENTADNAHRWYNYQNEINIIPWGIPEPLLPPRDRSKLALPENDIVLATLGRLVARKANHQLIEILARLRGRNVSLIIMGDGPQRSRLAELAKQLNVAQRVQFTGHVNEDRKLELLRAADIFVSTTLHEGFGLMYLDALFCGLPIVTYDHGGQSDFLENGKTGFLVPVGDKELFQSRLESLIEDAQLRRTMGQYNLLRSREFTIQQCARKFEAVFEELITDKYRGQCFEAKCLRLG